MLSSELALAFSSSLAGIVAFLSKRGGDKEVLFFLSFAFLSRDLLLRRLRDLDLRVRLRDLDRLLYDLGGVRDLLFLVLLEA